MLGPLLSGPSVWHSAGHLCPPPDGSRPLLCPWRFARQEVRGTGERSPKVPRGGRDVLTFGLTVLEGRRALLPGEQPPSAGEAAGAPGLGLVSAHGAGLAGSEAVCGEEAWGALAWKSEVAAQAGGRMPRSGPCSQPSPAPGKGAKAPRLGVGGGETRGSLLASLYFRQQGGLWDEEQVASLLSWEVWTWVVGGQRDSPQGAGCTRSSHVKLQADATLMICRAGPEQREEACEVPEHRAGTKGGDDMF